MSVQTFERWNNTLTVLMHPTECTTCGMPFCVPHDFDQRNRTLSNRKWFCPQGHHNYYGESVKDKMQREVDAANARANLWRERSYEKDAQLQISKREHAATKGKLTKHKKRAAAGVCPCCNRTFKQLAAHMKQQHPDFAVAAD